MGTLTIQTQFGVVAPLVSLFGDANLLESVARPRSLSVAYAYDIWIGVNSATRPLDSSGHELMRRLTTRNPTLLGTSPHMVFHLHTELTEILEETSEQRLWQLFPSGGSGDDHNRVTAHETDEKYKHIEDRNKANRASERCAKYTGGSATPMQTKAKMTHTLNENKEKFADKRSTDIWDEYIDNTAIATQRAAESRTSTLVDPDEVWRQTVSEPDAKNRIYGVGGFLASTLKTSVFAPQDTSGTVTSDVPSSKDDTVDLQEQVLLLNQNIHDMARQLQESEERQKAMSDELRRRPGLNDEDIEKLEQQMREELRLMQEARRQMGLTGEHMRAGASSAVGGSSSSATAAQDPPLLPPPPPTPQKDDDEDYVDP
ncbi:hypothetical protein PIB30_020944 [Stylosanthes scabra]|uniref:Uncharacterized protein n=1 Tax=Stylosanthes scabra TaxID=79078 RepID=A0ABU6Q8R1_9FABA|nr:hypothetical protein [Stylosanthes scabra]